MASGHIDWLQRASLRHRQRASYLDFWVTEGLPGFWMGAKGKDPSGRKRLEPCFFTPVSSWFSPHLRQFEACKDGLAGESACWQDWDRNSVPQIYTVEGENFSSTLSSVTCELKKKKKRAKPERQSWEYSKNPRQIAKCGGWNYCKQFRILGFFFGFTR